MNRWFRLVLVAFLSFAAAATFTSRDQQTMVLARTQVATTGTASAADFNDSHFHLTNYIQEGIDIHKLLDIMGTRIGRSTLFGIPLQQTWSYPNSGDFAPTYYLQTDAPL